MNYLDWHVGMKVVCINDVFALSRGEVGPVAGEIYTVRTISSYEGEVYIRLVEVVNRSLYYRDGGEFECCWAASEFRPVQTRKTDISIFTAMLHGEKVDA